MSFTFRPITKNDTQTILNWRYKPPLHFYNPNANSIQEDLEYLLAPHNSFYTMLSGTKLEGYCSFGSDGQVSGGDYTTEALDIGIGIHPDLTGQGRGIVYVNAVVEFALCTFSHQVLRVTVAQFNQRAQRVWEKAGFKEVTKFCKHESNTIFVIMTRDIEECDMIFPIGLIVDRG